MNENDSTCYALLSRVPFCSKIHSIVGEEVRAMSEYMVEKELKNTNMNHAYYLNINSAFLALHTAYITT